MGTTERGVETSAGDTSDTGLTASEAATRLAADGPNRLPESSRRPPWLDLLAQFTSFFAVMLWVAAVLAVVGGLPELGVAIAVVIVVNGVFAFVQEHRAERVGAALRDLLPAETVVVRDGVTSTIAALDLVCGDLVLLGDGDRVSADMRCLVADGLRVDTSTLTGESVPVPVGPGDGLFAGTFVVEGRGRAVVVATGASTRIGSIASLTQGLRRPDTPLIRELHRLVVTVSRIAVGAGVSFGLLTLVLQIPAEEAFVFAIGVTVALVPEALLPTVTLSLAVGAQQMAERHALVRRLESVETLGSTTVICLDKTGTLTQNRMSVVAVWTPSGSVTIAGVGYEPDGAVTAPADAARQAAADALGAARRASTGRVVRTATGWAARGDPMEAAIDVACSRAGVDGAVDEAADPVVASFPFDPIRRRESVLTATRVIVKGAPDSVLDRCTGSPAAAVDAARAELDRLAGLGYRVLAVAVRPAAPGGGSTDEVGSELADELERELTLLGLLALEDPPRASAFDAVAACRGAGIALAMVTGDHPVTAAAIAREVGLATEASPVLVGTDLPADDEALGRLIDVDGVVVARVSPEDKLRIARALRARGHVVAMTGDGVNDGPALREADIGVAMGSSGTDVAREAADLVLLDDDFATIVAAVGQGRATFSNARRFLTYHLSDNVAELTPFVLWAGSGRQFPLALGVLQILALDIGTDTLSAVALGAEPPGDDVLRQPPAKGRLLDRTVARRAFGVLGPVEAVFEIGAFLVAMAAAGWRPGDGFPEGAALAAASGAAFLTVVVAQTANAFACRSSTRPAWALGWTTNRLLIWAALIELLVAASCIWIPPVADLLEHAAPPAASWPVILASGPAVLIADALWKRRHAAA